MLKHVKSKKIANPNYVAITIHAVADPGFHECKLKLQYMHSQYYIIIFHSLLSYVNILFSTSLFIL